MLGKHEKQGKGFNAQDYQDKMVIATEKANIITEL